MNTETTTLELTDRELETVRKAMTLFAVGVRGGKPGYLADYTEDEYRIYFSNAVGAVFAKINRA